MYILSYIYAHICSPTTHTHSHPQHFVQGPSGPAQPLLHFFPLCPCLTHTQADSCPSCCPLSLVHHSLASGHTQPSSFPWFFPGALLIMCICYVPIPALWGTIQGPGHAVWAWSTHGSGAFWSWVLWDHPPTPILSEISLMWVLCTVHFLFLIWSPRSIPQMVIGEQGPCQRRGQWLWAGAENEFCSPAQAYPMALCPSLLSLSLNELRTAPSLFPFPNISQAARQVLETPAPFSFYNKTGQLQAGLEPPPSDPRHPLNEHQHGHLPLSLLSFHSAEYVPLFCLLKDSGRPLPPTLRRVGSAPNFHPSRVPVWCLPSCLCNDSDLGAVSWWIRGTSPHPHTYPGKGKAQAFQEPITYNLVPPPLHPLQRPLSRFRFSKP